MIVRNITIAAIVTVLLAACGGSETKPAADAKPVEVKTTTVTTKTEEKAEAMKENITAEAEKAKMAVDAKAQEVKAAVDKKAEDAKGKIDSKECVKHEEKDMKPHEEAKKAIQALGYEITKFDMEENCFEVKGKKDGKPVEVYCDTKTLELIKSK
jgi:hypothetical protein